MCPKVRVTVTAVLANYLGGQRDFVVEADSVRAVIEELAKKYGSEIRRRLFDEEGRLRRYINIYVNDKGLSHQELDMKLQDGDEVLILPAVSGGQDLRLQRVLPALLAVGLLVQIALGELGLAVRALRDIHAAIGLAGLVLTAYALWAARSRRASFSYLVVLLVLVLVQAILGLILFGLFSVDLELFELVETIHRYNAYLMLVVGLVGGIAVAVARRRAGSAEAVAKGG